MTIQQQLLELTRQWRTLFFGTKASLSADDLLELRGELTSMLAQVERELSEHGFDPRARR